MKHSIRVRFALVFVGVIAFILLAAWGVNNWLLEDFYTAEKVGTLEEAYAQIDAVALLAVSMDSSIIDEYEKSVQEDDIDQSSIRQMFRIFGEKYNTSVVLLDSVTDKALLPSVRDGDYLSDRIQKYIFGKNTSKIDVMKEHDNYTIQRTFDKRTSAYYLESWGYLSDNRTAFLMSMPIASIRDSVGVFNRFLAYVGLAALLLSSAIIYLTTKKITLPILKLADLSKKMSDLDFDAKYTGDAQDEIGILGNSMNKLSDKLKETIGELKSANLELKADIEEKIKVDEMRKDFIANVSHELKTPIALIQGYAEGLTEGMCEDEESRNYYCEVIMDEANKMNKMVRQLLNLTALESGNDALVIERFDLVELIKGVIASASILIQQKEASVCFEQESPVYVWADEFKIEEVITNYLSNALNHLDGERKIIVTLESDGKEAVVTVFNSGHHIPDEDIGNLWTKFFKVDKAHTREYGGSGIGLSIVKAIMDSHQKECGVRNVESGVEFWFTLDCYSENN